MKAVTEVSKLRERYPASRTPGEVRKLAGIDPKDFGLEEDLAG